MLLSSKMLSLREIDEARYNGASMEYTYIDSAGQVKIAYSFNGYNLAA
jgi:hypothetical protein